MQSRIFIWFLFHLNYVLGQIHVAPTDVFVDKGQSAVLTCYCYSHYDDDLELLFYINGTHMINSFNDRIRIKQIPHQIKDVSIGRSLIVDNATMADNGIITCSCEYLLNNSRSERKNATLHVRSPETAPSTSLPVDWQVIAEVGNSFKKSHLKVTRQGHSILLRAEKTIAQKGKLAELGLGRKTVIKEWQFVAPHRVDAQTISAQFDEINNQVVFTGVFDDTHNVKIN